MQGFILHTQKAKNEDTIATILTPRRLYRLYRFYGARHPIVTAGFKIDFEIQSDATPFLPRLRHVMHLGFSWLKEPDRLSIWRHFLSLLHQHLKDISECDSFYYEMLEHSAAIWHLQNPKRTAIEAYLKLLAHEGRLHPPHTCFICQKPLTQQSALLRAFLPAHPFCAAASTYPTPLIAEAFDQQSTLSLPDQTVDQWWLVMLHGL